MLEAGFETNGRPLILLLHGFPELAYSWRKIMLPLAAAGYHVVAPDQRGYGRTTGWDGAYDGDLDSFRLPNLVRDALGLVSALGYRSVAAVVGHDFGSPVAAYCALIRPDVFRSVALMSAPFGGPPQLPFDTAESLRRPLRLVPPPLLRTWRGLTRHGSITSAITRRAKRTMTCGGPAGRPRVSARLLSLQERGLDGEQAIQARLFHGPRAGANADLLHHGSRQGDGGDRGRAYAV